MTVDSFDPKAMSGAVTDAQVAQWLAVAERCGVGGDAVAIEQVDHGLVASLFCRAGTIPAVSSIIPP
ncbi:MAG: hypothetical protein CM15mP68_5770 [Pseudomonadota bacterium]|nr:MAG: hypothetical protein CM15mP68_5770 [Pseudomonadota bacterium]